MMQRIKEKGWEEKEWVREIEENTVLREEKELFEREFSCAVEVYDADEVGAEEVAEVDSQNRRRMALPTRLGIFVV
jgi:hypothetical protein